MNNNQVQAAKFTIRPIRRSDVKEIIQNYYARYEELKRNPNLGLAMQERKPSMRSELKWADKLLKDVRQNNAVAMVAIVDGHVVGMCDVRTEAIMEKEHVGTLGIAINEGYRSMGIGTALIREVLLRSKKRFEILRLEAFEINKKAISLYEKMGFKVYGRLPNGYMRANRRINQVYMYIRLK